MSLYSSEFNKAFDSFLLNDLNLVAKSNNLIDALYKSAKHKGISKFRSIIFSFFPLSLISNLWHISSYKLLLLTLNNASAFSLASSFFSDNIFGSSSIFFSSSFSSFLSLVSSSRSLSIFFSFS